MTTKAKTKVKQPHVKEYLEPLEARKGKEWVFPEILGGGTALPAP